MHGLWGMGQMMFSKYIVVVDEDCDVHNTSEVLFRLCANTDPERDSTIIRNPSDSLDHAPTEQNIGSHMGIDATRKLPGENYHRPWPELLKMDERVQAIVDSLRKTRDNCTPNQKCLSAPQSVVLPLRARKHLVWAATGTQTFQSHAPSGVALRLPSKESGQNVRLAHRPQACVPSRQHFLEPLEVHRSRPRAIEVQSAYDAND